MDTKTLTPGMKFRPRPVPGSGYDSRFNERTLEVITTELDPQGRVEVYSVNHKLKHVRRIRIAAKRLLSSAYRKTND